ncbi:MAG: YceI family protein [Flavobacteriaceae bacterium]|nr:YceI family protein [Flavobacteriaceae bacterium]
MRILIAFILCGTITAIAQNGSFVVDTTQSEVAFRITHLAAFKVNGTFTNYSGNINFDNGAFRSLTAKVMVNSIDTGNDERDDILRTEPYFDISNFPDISFSADNITSVEDETILSGRLTIKGEQRELKIPVIIDHDAASGRLEMSGETMIRRKEYDLVFGSMNGLIGDKVDIKLRIVSFKD